MKISKMQQMKKLGRQAGLTLIELTVVLLVLIGLASVTLPYISGFVGKTHNATSAYSGTELFNDLQLFNAQYGGIPNNLNLLTTSGGALPVYLDNTYVTTGLGKAVGSVAGTAGTTYAGTNFAPAAAALGTNGLASLNGANVTSLSTLVNTISVVQNGDGTYSAAGTGAIPAKAADATFNSEVQGGLTPSATTTLLTDQASGGTIAGILNYTIPTGHQLDVLGIGQVNAAVGKTLASAPVHFGDKASLQPQITYSRLLAAIDVDLTTTQANARIVGIVHAPDTGDGWESLSGNIESYYSSN